MERTQTIRSQVPIVAPFAGRVIARDLTKGELVETTHKLFVVADLSTVWVVANVSEKDVSYVQRATAVPNQPVEVFVTAYPDDVFQGTVVVCRRCPRYRDADHAGTPHLGRIPRVI